MSSFAAAPLAALVDAFWRRQKLPCPKDGNEVRAYFHTYPSGYLLILVCLTCGTKAQITHYSDPKRPTFRPWTLRERNSLARDQQRQRDLHCPVCTAQINHRIHEDRTRRFDCARCGNQHDAISITD